MEEASTVWERVDEPVLRYVAALEYNMQWRFDRRGQTEEIPALTGEQLDSALRRLEEHGLIFAGNRNETIGYFSWSRVRLTPDGWRVLGEWPPAAEADIGAALVHVLRGLADTSSEPAQAKSLRRAAGSIGRLAGSVVFDVAKSEIRRAGGELT